MSSSFLNFVANVFIVFFAELHPAQPLTEQMFPESAKVQRWPREGMWAPATVCGYSICTVWWGGYGMHLCQVPGYHPSSVVEQLNQSFETYAFCGVGGGRKQLVKISWPFQHRDRYSALVLYVVLKRLTYMWVMHWVPVAHLGGCVAYSSQPVACSQVPFSDRSCNLWCRCSAICCSTCCSGSCCKDPVILHDVQHNSWSSSKCWKSCQVIYLESFVDYKLGVPGCVGI